MISKKNWLKAQEYEKSYWRNHQHEADTINNIRYYKRECNKVFNEINKVHPSNSKSKILQIGPAHRDIINFWPLGKKFAIDPLKEFYDKSFYMDENVNYVCGVAERLPYKKNFFDVIIISNVLDHVMDPEKVLAEALRVLKHRGILYVKVHTFGLLTQHIHRLARLLKLDKGHLHTFNSNMVDSVVSKDFTILSRIIPDRKKILYYMRKNININIRLLGLLNIAIIPYVVICQK